MESEGRTLESKTFFTKNLWHVGCHTFRLWFCNRFSRRGAGGGKNAKFQRRSMEKCGRCGGHSLKRCGDVCFASLGLILFLPLFPVIYLAILLDSSGPAIYRQVRVGQGGKLFCLLKFRTMIHDAEKYTGAVWAKSQDARITRVGHFLRKSHLDEIPQLINVLRGDMSLVGPRPERPEFLQMLQEASPFYDMRHKVKPGLTGLAQICYPYAASVADSIQKLHFDLEYIKNQSFCLDYTIIYQTLKNLLFTCAFSIKKSAK